MSTAMKSRDEIVLAFRETLEGYWAWRDAGSPSGSAPDESQLEKFQTALYSAYEQGVAAARVDASGLDVRRAAWVGLRLLIDREAARRAFGYVSTAGKHAAEDARRRTKPHREIPWEDDARVGEEEEHEGDFTRDDLRAELWRARQELPAEDRELIERYYCEGGPEQLAREDLLDNPRKRGRPDVARTMRDAQGAVQKRIQRIRDALGAAMHATLGVKPSAKTAPVTKGSKPSSRDEDGVGEPSRGGGTN